VADPLLASIREAEPDELPSLEALVTAVFGAGDRPRGWFERKLAREVVAPALSKIAVDHRGRRIGFLLASAPASLPGVARLVSLGVLPTSRHHGVGRALIEAATTTAAAAGLRSMTALAEADRRSFYVDTGFSPEEVLWTLLAPQGSAESPAPTSARRRRDGVLSGSSEATLATPATPATLMIPATIATPATPTPPLATPATPTMLTTPEGAPSPTGRKVALQRLLPAPWGRAGTRGVGGWLAEAWERTPTTLRQTYALGGPRPRAWVHVSREGEAQLIHRLLLRSLSAPRAPEALAREVCELARSLAEELTPGGPLLFYGLPAVSPITARLLEAGWTCVQESTRMIRCLSRSAASEPAPSVDRKRPPAP